MGESHKIFTGLIFGAIAGIIDVIPMVLQNQSWGTNLSAFSLLVVAGFMISTSKLKINSIARGMLISFLLLIPCAILIGWSDPMVLIPILITTLVLGGILGFAIGRIK